MWPVDVLLDDMIHAISSNLVLGSSYSKLMKGVGQLALFKIHCGGPGLVGPELLVASLQPSLLLVNPEYV